jgi:radical SAM protein with 4Fe4S-binding SPASM domain
MDEMVATASQIAGLGCKEVTLIGGEIRLVPNWQRIGRILTTSGLTVNMMSNGYGYTESTLDEIEYAGLTNVGISIDGLEDHHDTIRNRRGSYSSALQSLEEMRRRGIHTAVVTCVFKETSKDLESLYGVLVRCGVEAWQLQLTNAMGRHVGSGSQVDSATVRLIASFIERKAAEKDMIVYAADSIGYFCGNERGIRGGRTPLGIWEGCQAGLTSFFIDSVGNVKGCGSLYAEEFIEGNVRSEPLAAIWHDQTRFSYNRSFDPTRLSGTCRECDAAYLCRGGCRSANYFNNKGKLYESASCGRLAPHALLEGDAHGA